MRRGIQFAERFVISERRNVGADSQLIGEADLVALAGGDGERQSAMRRRYSSRSVASSNSTGADGEIAGGTIFHRRKALFGFLVRLATRDDPERVFAVIDGEEAIHAQQTGIGKGRAMFSGAPHSDLSS